MRRLRMLLLGMMFATPPLAAAEIPTTSKIVSVDLFKNGLAVVRREATLGKAGAYVLDDIPDAIHGTYWIDSVAPIETLVRTREVDVPVAVKASALQNFREAPIQVNAATRVYQQQLARYNNGLADLIDVTTALFTLNRAETDRDVAFTNVWQALLMKAAATGDFGLFINEF